MFRMQQHMYNIYINKYTFTLFYEKKSILQWVYIKHAYIKHFWFLFSNFIQIQISFIDAVINFMRFCNWISHHFGCRSIHSIVYFFRKFFSCFGHKWKSNLWKAIYKINVGVNGWKHKTNMQLNVHSIIVKQLG